MTCPIPNVSTDHTGRVALFTGASSDLGVRFSRTQARCGAGVAPTARRLDRLSCRVNARFALLDPGAVTEGQIDGPLGSFDASGAGQSTSDHDTYRDSEQDFRNTEPN
jgi:NAD(P)-dependent dehydrogenase (short-subunit alcohol dehydrogenase family)